MASTTEITIQTPKTQVQYTDNPSPNNTTKVQYVDNFIISLTQQLKTPLKIIDRPLLHHSGTLEGETDLIMIYVKHGLGLRIYLNHPVVKTPYRCDDVDTENKQFTLLVITLKRRQLRTEKIPAFKRLNDIAPINNVITFCEILENAQFVAPFGFVKNRIYHNIDTIQEIVDVIHKITHYKR